MTNTTLTELRDYLSHELERVAERAQYQYTTIQGMIDRGEYDSSHNPTAAAFRGAYVRTTRTIETLTHALELADKALEGESDAN